MGGEDAGGGGYGYGVLNNQEIMRGGGGGVWGQKTSFLKFPL